MQYSMFNDPTYQCTRSIDSQSSGVGAVEPLRSGKPVAEEAVVHYGIKESVSE
jgi:hypothetical protein